MTGTQRLQQLLLDVFREHAVTGQACRVTCTPPRCKRPRTLDCWVDSIGPAGRVNLQPLYSREYLTVPVRRVRRVELLQVD